jgi:NAD(P)-dependent dehydrogenase (short-subunit alcohol dehydrogenase family)
MLMVNNSQRYGTVKEIADATVYLFSDAGNYVNGETIVGKLLISPFSVPA